MDNMQPGQVIAPHSSDDPQQPEPQSPGAPMPDRPDEEPEENPNPVPTPMPEPETMLAGTEEPAPSNAVAPGAGWRFHRTSGKAARQSLPDDITWTASEFIVHEKSPAWYGAVVVAGVVAAAADFLLFKDIFSTGVILFAAIAFAVISARKPHTQQYALTPRGLQIGIKSYYFQDFKSFSVTEEGAIASVIFMPLKRFMPPLTVYVAPDMEEQVLNFLSEILPLEQHRADAVDSLMRHIRF